MTVLAVEELSAVDASVAIFVDVQNTLVNTLLRKWASGCRSKRRFPPRLASDLLGAVRPVRAGLGLGRVRASNSRHQTREHLDSRGPQAVDHERRRGGAVCGVCEQ